MNSQNKQHFGHNHALISLKFDEHQKIKYCKACTNPIFDQHFHGCKACEFYLHESCTNLPRSLEHPSHPSHPLALFPSPTYSSGAYTCNACGSQGEAYSFSCAHCEFDLHVQCACLPESIVLVEKHSHKLKLTFESVFGGAGEKVVSCNLCSNAIVHNRWLYYCDICGFGAHLECVLPENVSKGESKKTKGKEKVERAMEVKETRQESKKDIHQRVYEQRLVRQAKIKELKAKIKELEVDLEWDNYCRELNYY